jgi:murein tripeptide amidase MpaA
MPKTKKKTSRKNNKTLKRKIVRINSKFESGNIIHKKTANGVVNLEIREERSPWYRKKKYNNWFYFKASNLEEKTTFHIGNIRDYFNSWKGFTVCYSYDNKNWKRLKTTVNGLKKSITWTINPKKSTVWFAFYPPYPFSKSKKLLPHMKTIGYSAKKRPILMKKIGSGPHRVWLISGQHPGETINSWMLEGFVKRLMKKKSILSKKYTFFIIPNANPDGNIGGRWYVNGKGQNLNRDWFSTKTSEVKAIKKQMSKYGYDLVFDLHGDEGCKNHFIVSSHKRKHHLHDIINKKLNQKNKHFQLKNYYTEKDMKGPPETLDDYTIGITLEGCMKHHLYNHKTLQEEPLKIGKDLLDILAEIN